MGKLAIMDYSTTSIHIYDEEFDTDFEPDNMEEIIADLGYNNDEIYYMFGDNIEVIEHKEVVK